MKAKFLRRHLWWEIRRSLRCLRCSHGDHNTVLLSGPCVSPSPRCSNWPGVVILTWACLAAAFGLVLPEECHQDKPLDGFTAWQLLGLLPNPFTPHQGAFAGCWELLMGSTSVRKLFTQPQISKTATTGRTLHVGAAPSGHCSSGFPKHPSRSREPALRQSSVPAAAHPGCRTTSHLPLSTQALKN